MAGKKLNSLIEESLYIPPQVVANNITASAHQIAQRLLEIQNEYQTWEERTRDLNLPYYDLNGPNDQQLNIRNTKRWIWRRPRSADDEVIVLSFQSKSLINSGRVVHIRHDNSMFRIGRGKRGRPIAVLTIDGQPFVVRPHRRVYFATPTQADTIKAALADPIVLEKGQRLLDDLVKLRNQLTHVNLMTNWFHDNNQQQITETPPNLQRCQEEKQLQLECKEMLRRIDLALTTLLRLIETRNNVLITLAEELPFAANNEVQVTHTEKGKLNKDFLI